jgi:hypothetical protein
MSARARRVPLVASLPPAERLRAIERQLGEADDLFFRAIRHGNIEHAGARDMQVELGAMEAYAQLITLSISRLLTRLDMMTEE